MLYPKEDKVHSTLQYVCRHCFYSEPALSACIFRNNLNNSVGETAGVTQDVGSDPTVGGECHFCTLCGEELKCSICGGMLSESDGIILTRVDEFQDKCQEESEDDYDEEYQEFLDSLESEGANMTA